jgi:Alpha/beta hydrolase family
LTCIVHLVAFGELAEAGLPWMNTPMNQSRFLAPGLLLLLFGQAHAQPPEYWYVSTRACPQVLGTEPGPSMQVSRFDSHGCISRCDPGELQAAASRRPVIILIHGSYYTAPMAITEGPRIRNDLAAYGALTADAIVVTFDWPSEFADPHVFRDGNEKARLAFVAGFHLARFLQGFPAGSRISLVGHSHGGLVALSALHLLAGGPLDTGEEATIVREASPSLRLRAVVIAAGVDRDWLEPGRRLDHALAASEGVLCLYNQLDPVLVVHPFGRYSDQRRALGKWGMSDDAQQSLGSLAGRYCQQSIALQLGPRHTFRGSTEYQVIVGWIRPYTWADVR